VQDGLAEEILGGRVSDGSRVLVDANDDGIVLLPGGPVETDAAA
jgi:ATP-dependent Clp protease ATP-binding subunit ClpB